jgi:hypothetical protein
MRLDQRLVCALWPTVLRGLGHRGPIAVVSGLDIQRKWLWLVLALDDAGAITRAVQHGMITTKGQKLSRYRGAAADGVIDGLRLALASRSVGTDVALESLEAGAARAQAVGRKATNVGRFLAQRPDGRMTAAVRAFCDEVGAALAAAHAGQVARGAHDFEDLVRNRLSRQLVEEIRQGADHDPRALEKALATAVSVFLGSRDRD